MRNFRDNDVIGLEFLVKDFSADPSSFGNYSPKFYSENCIKYFDPTDEASAIVTALPVMKKMYVLRTFRNGIQTSPWMCFPDISTEIPVHIGISPKGREMTTILPNGKQLAEQAAPPTDIFAPPVRQ